MPCHLSKIQELRWQGGILERGCLAHREISWLSSLAQGASPHSHFQARKWLFPLLLKLHIKICEERKARSSWGFMARKIYFLWSITSNNLFICSAEGLRGFSLNFLALKHLLLFLGITQQSTSRWIWWCQKDCIITIQQLTLVLGRRARKGAVPL